MPRSPKDNQQLKEARRIEILRAASRVFAKKGFAAAKISDIAREAGLSHGLVYHYFENKDGIFGAILEEKLKRMKSAMAADEALPGTGLDRMRATMTHWLARTQEEPEMGLMIAQAILSDSLGPEVRAMMARHHETSFAESVERIRDGQKRGEIGKHAPAEELATSMMCIMRGLALTALVGPSSPSSTPCVDTIMRLLLPGDALACLDSEHAARGPASGLVSIPRAAKKHAPRGALARSLPKKTARKATR